MGILPCGKSTLAKALAAALAYGYVDSGAMYRAVTLYFLDQNIDIENEAQVAKALERINIRFVNKNGKNHTLLKW